MKTYITVVILIFLLLSSPVQAIEGYVELGYDFMNNPAQATIELWETFDKLTIGIKGVSDISYTLKGGVVPAGAPLNQYYEGYITYKLNNQLQIKGKSYCTHWFSQSGRSSYFDEVGLYVGVRYTFGKGGD